MDKPEPVTRSFYDYQDCAEYISQKHFDGRCLRDFSVGDEYRDFWHWVIDVCEVHNGCVLYLGADQLGLCKEPWQREILEAFIKEFGDDQEYWVEW